MPFDNDPFNLLTLMVNPELISKLPPISNLSFPDNGLLLRSNWNYPPDVVRLFDKLNVPAACVTRRASPRVKLSVPPGAIAAPERATLPRIVPFPLIVL